MGEVLVTGVANAHAARSPLLLIGGAAPLDPAAYRRTGQVSMAI